MTEVAPDAALAHAGAVPPLSNYTRADMWRDLATAFGTNEGRRALGHILAWCTLWTPTVVEKGQSATEAALIHEGRRMVGLLLLQHLQSISGEAEQEVTYGGIVAKPGR